jgi:5-methylcytosine-specific restriction endonuclease McrBC regulatory subunit McrC
VHHGRSKEYRSIAANGAAFRGRLEIAEHIRDNAARSDRFFVEY